MTPTEKQILKNQRTLMMHLWNQCQETFKGLSKGIDKTTELLNPTTQKENCCEMPEECVNVSKTESEVKR